MLGWPKSKLFDPLNTMEYYSAIKKNETLPFAATCLELEIVILNELSQMKKDKYHVTYMWDIKDNANGSIYKTKADSHT